ncbi:hypothetical protein QJS10_CPB11g00942 [Acorus calamus]|uniref:Uncharacterized protein n=1 Tax=Acorus calamus TaxID=4465 RepID=A0AAV9DPV8_ACOCL|nr:hypothetical protein QJS10_CPB11g00942 [Acorus calamus]
MGCCFSKKKDRRIPADAPPPPESEANAPPVEETVKEVLSETPKLSSAPPPRDRVKRSAVALISDERSDDASEICSLSESVSTAVTTTTEKAEELERFREWRAERRSASPANVRAAADPKGLGRSSSSRRGMASPRRDPLPEPEEDGGWGVEKAAFPAAANELLENPLVSLECFIFL